MKKELSYTEQLASITVVFKSGDRKGLKNYRPLNSTNTDYKNIAFIFARRFQKVINKLIGNNQSAYIKGGYIGVNARLIMDLYENCKKNYDGDLDFTKAPNSV